MRLSELLKRLQGARVAVEHEISGNKSRGRIYARGLANEGWAGGYKQALDDIEAMATHGYPTDPRSYWRIS